MSIEPEARRGDQPAEPNAGVDAQTDVDANDATMNLPRITPEEAFATPVSAETAPVEVSSSPQAPVPDRQEETSLLFVSRNRKFAPEPQDDLDPAADAGIDDDPDTATFTPLVDVPPTSQPRAHEEHGSPNPEMIAFASSLGAAGTPRPAPPAGPPVGPPPQGPAPSDAPPQGRPMSPRTKIAAAVLGGVGLIAAGGWTAAYAAAGDRTPSHAEVAGVAVGGKTATQARSLLTRQLAERAAQPITVKAGGKEVEVDPGDAGLRFDAARTVDRLDTGRTWSPAKLWHHFLGHDDVEPVVTADPAKVAAVADTVNKQSGRPAKNGALVIKKGKAKITEPVAGEGVSTDALTAGLSAKLLAAGDRTADVPLGPVDPSVSKDDIQQALDTVAEPALSGPITLKFAGSPVKLKPKDFGSVIEFTPKDGRLAATVSHKALKKLLDHKLAAGGKKAVDATVKLVDGRPKVIPAKAGVTYDQADLEKVFLQVATASGDKRTAEVKSKVAQPKVTTADAKKWGIKEKISEFTTYFPYAEYRNVNIGRAGELINGTVLPPGKTFSLNKTVGERTKANGFTKGWMIQDGVFREDYGGGVSQMATTTFNAAFFAGLKDIEHKPHSLYIDRYPIGREATVAWPYVDLKFKNTTKYGVLISVHVTPATSSRQGVAHVAMYSTKIWDIKARNGKRYDFKPYGKRKITDGNCETTPGADGFKINVYRDFYKPGTSTRVKTEKHTTTYIPQTEVTCTDTTAKKPSGAGND